ncbi:hypothetical protein O3M35_005498 [Rhynocoris fuscipes]|uniref:Solute carrier family 66 member 3 n=1 Tax=Rhynocoris fuscipes TaxID=488301 RepID=A0AAW1DIC6_9HEMI
MNESDLSAEECFRKIFLNLNIQNDYCLKIILSKLLSITIIVISIIVILPQIFKIWKKQSARGINVLTILSNLYIITVKGCYCFVRSFPLSSYGELIIIGIQCTFLTALVLRYNVSFTASNIFIVLYPIVVYILASGITPKNILWYLQAIGFPIFFTGRMLQAHTIYKNKSTGDLSGFPFFIQFFITGSRIFTTIQETKDPILIFTQSMNTFSTGLICILFLYYNSKSGIQKKQTNDKLKTN